MTKRSTTITLDGRSWAIELLVGASKHECPRVEITPTDDPEARRMYAYKLGTDWFSPGYTEPTLRSAFDRAVQQLESSN